MIKFNGNDVVNAVLNNEDYDGCYDISLVQNNIGYDDEYSFTLSFSLFGNKAFLECTPSNDTVITYGEYGETQTTVDRQEFEGDKNIEFYLDVMVSMLMHMHMDDRYNTYRR